MFLVAVQQSQVVLPSFFFFFFFFLRRHAEQQSSGVISLRPEVLTLWVLGLGRPVCTQDCGLSVVQTCCFSEMLDPAGRPSW